MTNVNQHGAMTEKIKILTYNVNGIRNDGKHREIFHYLHTKQYDLILLQEIYSKELDEKQWSAEWGSKIWFAHGDSNSRGVAILFSKNCSVMVHNVILSPEGRYILLYLTWKKCKFLIANVYAPNKDSPQFMQEVFGKISKFTPHFAIIGGDFNLGIDVTVDRLGSTCNNDKAAKWLSDHLDNSDHVDVWRHLHEDKHGFTWCRNKPKVVRSRLDYFFVSEAFLQFVNTARIIPNFRSDHKMLELGVTFNPHKRGPGYWKLNTALLRDTDYVEKMNRLLEIELSDVKNREFRKTWELAKIAIRGSTIQYAARKQKSKRNIIEALERKIVKLEKELIDRNVLFNDTLEQIRKVKHELEQFNREKTRGAIVRAKARWSFQGEMPTKYFLKLEKKNSVNKALHRVMGKSNVILEEPKEILNEIKTFYQELYSSQGGIDTKYVEKLQIPQISQQVKERLEGNIDEAEVAKALYMLKNGKSPGCDGLPPEFYKMFYPKLRIFLTELYKEIVAQKEFHLSAKRGVLSLLEKLGKDGLFLTSWRPLSLLTTDNKIFSKLLATRLELGTREVIHHSQTGFSKGKHLSENILKILEVMHVCERKNINAVLISFDFFKAFDTVEWEAIFLALSKFGFGKKYIEMVKILFKDPLICAANNGFWSEFFSPQRGARQGCCFSPGIFNLVVELLGIGLRQNVNLKGIEVNGTNIRAGQFADDLWTTLIATKENIDIVLTELHEFGKMSGLKSIQRSVQS